MQEAFKILNGTEANEVLPYFSKLIFDFMNVDSFNLFTNKGDGKMAKLYSETAENFNSIEPVGPQEEATSNKSTFLEGSGLKKGRASPYSKFIGN